MISKKHSNMVKYNQLINQANELKVKNELDKEINIDKLAESYQQILNV